MDNLRDFYPESVTDEDQIASSGDAHAVDEIIPDRYLNQAIGACCTDDYGRLLTCKSVRNLIARYAPADQPWMSCIPQERRRQFLKELASVTGRALPPKELVLAEQNLITREAAPAGIYAAPREAVPG